MIRERGQNGLEHQRKLLREGSDSSSPWKCGQCFGKWGRGQWPPEWKNRLNKEQGSEIPKACDSSLSISGLTGNKVGGIRRETSEEAEDASPVWDLLESTEPKSAEALSPHLLPSLSSQIKYHYYFFFDKPSLVPSLQDLPQ